MTDPPAPERLAPVPALDAPVVTSPPGSFPHSVLVQRHPALIEQVRAAHPYEPEQHRRLDALLAEIADGVVGPLATQAPDGDAWRRWSAPYVGRSWFEVPFLWAESFFYRRLLEAVGYPGPGAWQGVDPFEPMKSAELIGLSPASEEHSDGRVDRGVGRVDPDVVRVDDALLLASLWGNQADLGFRIGAAAARAATGPGGPPSGPAPTLLADDRERLWPLLGSGSADVSWVLDNAGGELVADLLLLDHLLAGGAVARVTLHAKPYPYFVSDATTRDVTGCLRAIARSGPSGAGVAERLVAAARSGRLRIAAHWFWVTPFSLHRMPADLTATIAATSLVVLKGDLNYRRLVGDCAWPPSTPFAEVTRYVAAPVAVLRTLKSDVVVGLDGDLVADLDATGERWRTSGRYGVLQVAG